MEITANMVKELRAATGAGVLDCRKALENAEGNVERATELLREKGLLAAAKKAERQANEGLIGYYVAPSNKLGALVEVNCETDFVARTPEFQAMCQTLAQQVAEQGAEWTGPENLLQQQYAAETGRTVKDVLTEKVAKIGENMMVRRFVRVEQTEPGMIGSYVHTGAKVAALVDVVCEKQATTGRPEFGALVRDLAMQIVAARPNYTSPEAVPADVLETEKQGYLLGIGDANKPQQVIERIVAGKLAKFYEENTLMEQPFIRDDGKRIKDVVAEAGATLGDKLTVRSFARLEING